MAEEREIIPHQESGWNYFNYFTEVEEHFQRARGTGLFLMSPLDWALVESWKNSGLPLEAVLRGIDHAFEKWHSKKTKATRLVNSVAYCSQAIQQEADALAAAYPNLPKAGEGTFFLRTMDAIFIKAVDKHPERLPEYMRRLFQNVKPERLIRFMESCPTWLDRLAVTMALPLWPFLVAMMSIRSPTRSARL